MESQQELIMKIRRSYSLLSLKKNRRDHHHRRRCILSFSLSIICCLPNYPSHYTTSFKAPISYSHYYSSSFSNRIPRGGSSSSSSSNSCTANNNNNNNNNNNMTDRIMNDDYDDTMINPSKEVEDEEVVVIGGGAINEKKRTYSSYGGSNKYLDNDNDNDKSNNSKNKNSSTFRGTTNRAHLMHAIEGLHRYPNYLSRWKIEDIEELSSALQETLDKVRDQKSNVIKRRNDMEKFLQEQILLSSKEESESAAAEEEDDDVDNEWIKEFIKIPKTWNDIQEKILDPKASKAIFRSQMLRLQPPTVSEVLNGQIQIELDVGYLQQLMDEECYDCYSFPIFSKQFCLQLRRYIKYVITKQQQQMQMQMQNNNDNETTRRMMMMMTKDLDNIGLRWLNDLLLHLFVRPISKHLYKETELVDGDLDWRQGYIAAYSYNPTSTKPRQRLVPHTDDSEVTLNICLGDDNFEGGNLNLWGLRGSTNGNLKGEMYEPEIGRALIHSGRQLHEVTDITFGDRYAYILWTRSWNGIRSTTCPCCWLNNRGGQRRLQQTNINNNNNNIDCCICGRRWN